MKDDTTPKPPTDAKSIEAKAPTTPAAAAPATPPEKAPAKPETEKGGPKDIRDRAVKVESRPLPTVVDDKTMKIRVKELTDLLQKIDIREAEAEQVLNTAKAKAKEINENVEEMRSQMRAKARVVREGREDRPVEVAVLMDWDKKEVRNVRLDTAEVVSKRGMTPQELQKPLPFKGINPQPAKPELAVDNSKKADAKDEPAPKFPKPGKGKK